MARLSLSSVQRIGGLLGRLLYLVPNRERHNARVNIELCFPAMSRDERERLLRRALIESARTILEMPGIWRRDVRSALSVVHPGEGWDLPGQALAKGRGVIIAAPHLGAWELAGHRLAQMAPVTLLYRPPREAAIEPLLLEGRSRGGARLVPTSAAGVRALFEALKRGEMVGILPDQQPRQAGTSAGVFAPFFGVPALTMVLVNRLARRTGAETLFTYVERLPIGQGYRMHFLSAPPGIADADSEKAAAALNLGVEHCVRRCPQQYQWSYRRFSVRPAGARSPYRRGASSPQAQG
ncbi:MAG: lipid A biosynthesis acyltransferase [Gammaproteobacteria bacterium]|nr:lipid A biosynthesis acyltransferase [Gammaproteobacteria bacterium]